MNDIYDLLNIKAEFFSEFPLLANRVADHQIEKVINANTKKLKVIEERMYSDKNMKLSKSSIQDVIEKVKKSSESNENVDFTIRELRIVSYYLALLIEKERTFVFALDLLDKNWKDMYINGIAFFVLKFWNLIPVDYRTKATMLLGNKLKTYSGTNKRYLQIKNHFNLLELHGPERMAALLLAKKADIQEAPLLIGYKQSTFVMSYYSDVIINYFKNVSTSDLDSIEEVLGKHSLDRTKKLLFANLVERADQYGIELFQTQVSKLASRVLGDITLSSTWTPFPGATYGEIEKLRNAKNLVNLWFARKIIEVFFEVCVQDIARKKFWLQYVDYIRDFRVAGSTAVKLNLQRDSRISDMFSRYFIDTNSRHSQTAALILCLKNKVMIEFSDLGALYAYNPSDPKVALARKRYIDAVEDLKSPRKSILVDQDYYSYFFRDEGRMPHSGKWQERLSSWIYNKIILSTEPSVTLSDFQDEELFKTRSIKLEEFVFDDIEDVNVSYKPIENKLVSKYGTPSAVSATVVKETNVSFALSSKWVYNGICRVIANSKGYYIYSGLSKTSSLVKFLRPGVLPEGNLWIKRPDAKGWSQIVHSIDGTELTIGFMRFAAGYVYYKEDINQSLEKQIKL